MKTSPIATKRSVSYEIFCAFVQTQLQTGV